MGSPSREAGPSNGRRRRCPSGHLFRFFARWLGFTVLYSAFAVCPFCGRQACPVGLASAGGVGAFFAFCMQDWKRAVAFLRSRLSGRKEGQPENMTCHGRDCDPDCEHKTPHS